MPKLRVPSLQHLARNWRSDPRRTKQRLVDLAKNAPNFSYDPLYGAVRDMLVFGHPYDQIIEGVRRGIKRPDVRDNFLGVLPLIRSHFDGVSPTFVQAVDRRYYPVGRGLMVPFDPPLIYGTGGQIHFPWFIFWRSNPLAGQQLSLFVTLVTEVLLEDPDLEGARFTILDFSAPASNRPRDLSVIDARDIPRISEDTKVEMLSIFAEGFFLAQAELAGVTEAEPQEERDDEAAKGNQPRLFDRD